jgi:hypothetical protein
MDLLDLVAQTEFLGPEFAVWLWYHHDRNEGRHLLGDEVIELVYDDQMMLEGLLDTAEQCRLKGGSPADSPEAYKALKLGKIPTRVRLLLRKGEREWRFLFDTRRFSTSGTKLPTELRADGSDESFAERMVLLEELDNTLHALFGRFLTSRLTEHWETMLGEIKEWVALPTSDETLP